MALRLINPALCRFGLRLDLGQAALGGCDSPLFGLTLARQLIGVLTAQPLKCFRLLLSLFLQVGFKRLDLSCRPLFGSSSSLCRLSKTAFGRFDLHAKVLAVGLASFLAHPEPIYYVEG